MNPVVGVRVVLEEYIIQRDSLEIGRMRSTLPRSFCVFLERVGGFVLSKKNKGEKVLRFYVRRMNAEVIAQLFFGVGILALIETGFGLCQGVRVCFVRTSLSGAD